jgi:energy-coupling factor transporter transmembrane protein EcfT
VAGGGAMSAGVRAERAHLTTPHGARAGSDLRVPPRAYLGPLLLGSLLASMIAGGIGSGLLSLAVALVAAALAGASLPPRRWWGTMVTGIVIGWALNLYLTPGTPLVGWPAVAGRHASREGAGLGLLLTLRVAGALTALQGLRAAWPGERAADAIARLLGPLERLRLPVRESRAMLGLSLRFAPLLGGEARRIARIQDLRAGRPPRGAGEWLTRRRAATVPFLVGALERAERVALALDARHYRLRPVAAAVSVGTARRVATWTSASLGAALAGVALLWRA